MTEEQRKAAFKACPMAMDFLAVLLQDAQYHDADAACEEEREARDSGTIYDCPDSTFRAALAECEAFTAAIRASGDDSLVELLGLCDEQLGSDLYLERYGHGAGFRDRTLWDDDRDEARRIGEALSALVDSRGNLETYFGDDDKVYICGQESA